jgi:hypothetical protein
VAAIAVGAILLIWALTRPTGYAEFGWFVQATPSEAPLLVDTTSPQLVAAGALAGPLLIGLGGGFLLGRRRG